ncbi:MAG: hypothetical protein ACF8NJ_04735 [Phycisphaerales bacterium JB038]
MLRLGGVMSMVRVLATAFVVVLVSCASLDVSSDGLPSVEVLAEALDLLAHQVPGEVELDPSVRFGPTRLVDADSSVTERLEEAMLLAGIKAGDGRAARACAEWTSSRSVPIESVIRTPAPHGCDDGLPTVLVVTLTTNDQDQVVVDAIGWSRDWQRNIVVSLDRGGPKVLSSRASYLIH